MNPPVVLNQLMWCYVLVLIAVLPGSDGLRIFVLAATGVLFLEWLGFKTEYWLRARGEWRTNDRYDGDRQIGAALLLGSASVAAAIVILQAWVGETRSWGWRAWNIADSAPACVVVLFMVLPASSIIDWYFVRPRRDGITTEPVCWRTTDDTRRLRMRLTKWLLWHRAITTLLWGIGIAFVTFYLFYKVSRAIPQDSIWQPFLEEIDAPLSLAVIALTGWSQGLVSAIPALAGRAALVLGDPVKVISPDGPYEGFVYEVSLEGPTIITSEGRMTRPTKRLDDPILEPLKSDSLSRCPLPSLAATGERVCGGLDEPEKCQWGTHRRQPAMSIVAGGASDEPKPHPKPPVGLFSAW